MLLWFYILHILIGHSTLVDTREASLLTVHVAVPRTATEPSELLHLRRHLELEANTWYNCVLVGRIDVSIHHDSTVRTYLEVQLKVKLVGCG